MTIERKGKKKNAIIKKTLDCANCSVLSGQTLRDYLTLMIIVSVEEFQSSQALCGSIDLCIFEGE